MTSQQVQALEELCSGFQSYALTEMLFDWIRAQPNPQKVVNELIFAWRDSMRASFEAQWKAQFEKTGVIPTGRAQAEAMLGDAEKVIRHRIETSLRTEPDGQLIDVPDPDKIETPNAPN